MQRQMPILFISDNTSFSIKFLLDLRLCRDFYAQLYDESCAERTVCHKNLKCTKLRVAMDILAYLVFQTEFWSSHI